MSTPGVPREYPETTPGVPRESPESTREYPKHLRNAPKQVQMSQTRATYSRELTKALHPTQVELELPLALSGARKPGRVARVSHRRWQREGDGSGALFPPERPIDGTAYVDVEYSLEGSEEDLEGVDGRNYKGRSTAQRTSANPMSVGDPGVLGKPPPLADRAVRVPTCSASQARVLRP